MNAARPLHRAPAWIFLVVCASLATLLAAASFLVSRQPSGAKAGKGHFAVDGLADPTPAPVAKPQAAPAPQPEVAVAAPGHELPGAANKQSGKVAEKTAVARKREQVAGTPAPSTAEAKVPAKPAPRPAQPPETPIRPIAPDAKLQSASAPPAADSQYGTRVSGQIVIGDLTVPLPPGEWRVVADIPTQRSRDMALIRESGPVIAGAVVVGNLWGAGGLGFPKSAACTRPMVRGLAEKNEDFGDQACWSSTLVTTKTLLEYQPKTSVGRALRGELDAKGLTINSEVLLNTLIVFANTNRRVTMVVFYNPEVDGHQPKKIERPEDSEWHMKNLGQHPDKAKYVRERLLWASQTYQQLRSAFAALN